VERVAGRQVVAQLREQLRAGERAGVSRTHARPCSSAACGGRRAWPVMPSVLSA
jgi:hypothetical protein